MLPEFLHRNLRFQHHIFHHSNLIVSLSHNHSSPFGTFHPTIHTQDMDSLLCSNYLHISYSHTTIVHSIMQICHRSKYFDCSFPADTMISFNIVITAPHNNSSGTTTF